MDFVPSDPITLSKTKDSKKENEDSEESIQNDDKDTHPDGQKTTESSVDKIEGLKPLNKAKDGDDNEETKKDKIENDSADNPEKVSKGEARMDHAEDMNQENAYGEVDPEKNKDYGEEEDNSYDSVHGYQHTDEDSIEDEANSITDIDLNHDDVNISHDDVGTGK